MCNSIMVKQNAVNQLNKVDRTLAERVAKNVGVEVPEENEEVQSDAKDSQLTMEKYDIPIAAHSVAVLVNGNIDVDTLKSYAKTFAENDLNYAFVGQYPENLSEDFGITETFDTAHSTLFDSTIVLSDGSDIKPQVEEFVELTYKHNKPLIVNKAASQGLGNAKLKIDAPGVFVSDEPETIVKDSIAQDIGTENNNCKLSNILCLSFFICGRYFFYRTVFVLCRYFILSTVFYVCGSIFYFIDLYFIFV